ncbi:MAG: membrane protein insertion efficiency factor YidD [Ignavibacteriaceae bacterium]
MKYTTLFCLVIVINIFPQENKYKEELNSTDWQKWGNADYSYVIPEQAVPWKRNYSLTGEDLGGKILKSFADAYWFFVSDVDGDNCSFSPTCSSFFILAVKKSNILQGTLMFADRFTRDLNLFKLNHYPRVEDGHFYDPVSLYTLNKKNIKIITPESVVKN